MKLHFVVGTGRCGSSFVHEILANHEQVAFISNVDDNLSWLSLKGRFNNSIYAATRGAWTKKGTARFAPSEAFQAISREVSPIYENSFRDLLASDVTPWLRNGFQQFFGSRWQAQGRSCLLHKYTGWSRMGFFGEIFPEARFVHVVRDGRAVANSWLQMNWWGGYRGPAHWQWGSMSRELEEEWNASGRSFVVLAGICWRLLMDSFEQAASALDPGRYLEIRYEDFLAEPRESLGRILEFLELPWSHRLERSDLERRIVPSRKNAYERELTPVQLRMLENCIGEDLRRRGY